MIAVWSKISIPLISFIIVSSGFIAGTWVKSVQEAGDIDSIAKLVEVLGGGGLLIAAIVFLAKYLVKQQDLIAKMNRDMLEEERREKEKERKEKEYWIQVARKKDGGDS